MSFTGRYFLWLCSLAVPLAGYAVLHVLSDEAKHAALDVPSVKALLLSTFAASALVLLASWGSGSGQTGAAPVGHLPSHPDEPGFAHAGTSRLLHASSTLREEPAEEDGEEQTGGLSRCLQNLDVAAFAPAVGQPCRRLPRPSDPSKKTEVQQFFSKMVTRPRASWIDQATAPMQDHSAAVIKAAMRWRVTLLDLEAMVLPAWGFDVMFHSKEDWIAYVGQRDCDTVLSEIQGIRLACTDRLKSHYFIKSARSVELLNGIVLARLMTDGRPSCVMQWADPWSINRILSSLRLVIWNSKRHWMFPPWHQKKLLFVAWIGKELGLNPIWADCILPFLPIEAEGCHVPPEVKIGQSMIYLSTTFGKWLPCKVTDKCATSGSVRINLKPDAWITVEEQRTRLRPQHES